MVLTRMLTAGPGLARAQALSRANATSIAVRSASSSTPTSKSETKPAPTSSNSAFPYATKDAAKEGEIRLADPVDHSTGMERLSYLAYERGIMDPWCCLPRKRGPGTKDNPNIVPSFEDKRLIACYCEEDATTARYLWIHRDDPRRCKCGYWFKLVDAPRWWEEL